MDSLGVLPTPGISFCTRHSEANLGVAITASHNPYSFNGFKFFDADGEKIDFESESQQLRALAENPAALPDSNAVSLPLASSVRQQYLTALRDRASRIGQLKMKAVVDCANGATAESAPLVLSEVISDIQFIGASPDGTNINDGVGSTNLETTQEAVLEARASLGIAFDGDGDRVLFVDDYGAQVSGDQVLYLLARHRSSAKPVGGVVGTEMSNEVLAKALAKLDIAFNRADVGDKHILIKLRENGWTLGGEPSGHVISLEETNSGDGLWSALCVLEIIKKTGATLRELLTDIRLYPQAVRQIDMSNQSALDLDSLERDIVQSERIRFEGEGRILVRRSGTEPLLRVMVEHPQASIADEVANRLTTAIDGWLGRIQPA